VFAPNLGIMIPSRVILGFAVGGASVTVPVYLSELAPTERRGSLAGRGELAIVVGQLLAFAINAIIGTVWGEHPGVWRYMLAVAAIPAVALFVGMLQMPESPRWLISKDRHDEALAVLMQVRSEERARAEMEEVEFLAQEEKEAHMGGWSDLSVPWIRRIFIAGIGVAIFQQCTGINSIMYYGTQVLTRAGFSASGALIANVANGVLAVIGSSICLFFLMDRVPRRTLIIGGFIATTTAHALIVISAFLLPEGTTKAFVILFFMVTFVFCMQLALNIPVWVIISEMFPLRLRGLGMGICVLCLWVANAIIAFLFPIVVEAIRIEGAFLVFVVLGVIAIAFLKVFLPETKDRSLEELEERFAAGQFR
jgi:sugar porter (SP) family MFS transporter